MVLNKTNLAVRLVYATWESRPTNLCRFFWTLMASIVVLLWTWPLLLCRKFQAECPPAGAWFVPSILIWGVCVAPGKEGAESVLPILTALWLAPIIAIPIVVVVIALISAVCYASDAIQTYRACSRDQLHRKPSEPSIVRSYIKAKKAKVCPLIQYKD